MAPVAPSRVSCNPSVRSPSAAPSPGAPIDSPPALRERPEWAAVLSEAQALPGADAISAEAWEQLGRVLDSEPYPRPLTAPFLVALGAALQAEIAKRADLAAELREAADHIGDGPVSERLRARAVKLDAGVTLADLEAGGDKAASAVLMHERAVASAALTPPLPGQTGLSTPWSVFAGAVALVAVLLVLAGCGAEPARSPRRAPAAPAPSTVTVRELPLRFVAPESCGRMPDGWIVSEQGCGYEQPCRSLHEPHGRVVLVRDDVAVTDLITGLIEPKGVDVDSGGNLWVAHKGEFVVRTPAGAEIRTPIPGSKLLNDVAAAGASSAIVSDSVTGKVHRATLVAGHVTIEEAFTMAGAPNGLAVSGDVVAVAGLGDLEVPGLAGWIRTVGPGGEVQELAAPPERKFDGIVPWRSGFLFSSVYSRILGKNDTTLWVTETGRGPAEMVFDAAPYGLRSSADIGIDRASGAICIPDLNGSKGMTKDFEAGAKVLIVTGLP